MCVLIHLIGVFLPMPRVWHPESGGSTAKLAPFIALQKPMAFLCLCRADGGSLTLNGTGEVGGMSLCVCGSGREFEACCAPLLGGQAALTAEAMMRARYTAFVVGNLDYIERTHAAEVRELFDRLQAERIVDEAEWLGLSVRRVVDGGPDDQSGQVEFVARYKQRGQIYDQHELATFRREDGLWLYQSGQLNPKSPPRQVEKLGRNDPCSCGSGMKYKKCCGA